MKTKQVIFILKCSICFGLSLIALGIYLHLFNDYMASLGVEGIIISASCVAVGMIFSLPTKLYLTIVLMKHENDMLHEEMLAKEKLAKEEHLE